MKKFLCLLLLLNSCRTYNSEVFIKSNAGFPRLLCHVPVYYILSNNIRANHLEPIVRGIEYWEEALVTQVFIFNKQMSFDPEDSYSNKFILIGMSTSDEILTEEYLGMVENNYSKNGCVKSSRVIISGKEPFHNHKQLETVVRHEFGHVLGLTHSPDPNNVMFFEIDAGINYNKAANQEQIEAIRKIYNLP